MLVALISKVNCLPFKLKSEPMIFTLPVDSLRMAVTGVPEGMFVVSVYVSGQ